MKQKPKRPLQKLTLFIVFMGLVLGCNKESNHPPLIMPPAPVTVVPGGWTTPVEPIDCIPFTSHCLGPMPSNLLTRFDASTATGLRINLTEPYFAEGVFAFAAQHLDISFFNSADGFSPAGQIVIPLDAAISPDDLPQDLETSIQPDNPILLIDTIAMSPVPYHISLDPKGLAHDPPQYILVMIPAQPLNLATPHIVILRADLRQDDGSSMPRSPAFEKVKSSYNVNPLLNQLCALYQPLFTFIEESLGLDREDILLTFAFTTRSAQSLYSPMQQIRRVVEEQAVIQPPEMTIQRTLSQRSEPSLACEVLGSYPSPSFRSADEGTIQFDEEGLPIFQDFDSINVSLKLPKVPAGQKVPVVIFGHGLWAFKETVFQTSEDLLSAGFAIISIDAACHGSRILKDNFIGFLFRLETLDQAVSCLTQTIADELALVQLLKGDLSRLDLLPFDPVADSGDGLPDLDTDHIYYIGQSMGTVLGLTFVTLSKEIEAAVLNVPGSGIVNIVTHGEITYLMVGNNFIPKGTSPLDGQLLYLAGQMYVDYMDPINMTPHVTKDPLEGCGEPKDILLQVAMNDGLIPNWCTDIMARGLDIPVLEPYSYYPYGLDSFPAPISGSGLYQFDFIYAFPQIPLITPLISHGLLFIEPESRIQLVEYLSTAYQTGNPVIINPYE